MNRLNLNASPRMSPHNMIDKTKVNKILQETMNKTWTIFIADDILTNQIEYYIKSPQHLKWEVKSIIHTWFLSRRESTPSSSEWSQAFITFIDNIESLKDTNSNLDTNLHLKLFRNKENLQKINYIKQHTDLSDEIFYLAEKLSNHNPYHNFWHQIGVAENAIKLGIASNLDKKELNLIGFIWLFHDAGYLLNHENQDMETLAIETILKQVPSKILDELNINQDQIKYYIMNTKLSKHWKNDDNLVKIIQDADLAWLGYWPHYLLYSTMGLLDELSIPLESFLEFEEKFIQSHNQDGIFYQSEAAQKIFSHPKTALKTLKSWPKEVIKLSYQLRKENISFSEFQEKINSHLNNIS